MKRRTIVLGGGALIAAAGFGWVMAGPGRRMGPGEPVSLRGYDWKGTDFRAGGTAGIAADLPPPLFRDRPQCLAMAQKTLGPCHVNEVPQRVDVTEGIIGLPTRISLRLIKAESCEPLPGADVEIWHANAAGVYSGRAADMCNSREEVARGAMFLRGRQISDVDGVVNFLTVYPGWYGGRTVHVHLRAVLEGCELAVSQLLFDDALSDLIYRDHQDYAGRPSRDTLNGGDNVFDAQEASGFIFDTEKLDGGVLQASYTIGVVAG